LLARLTAVEPVGIAGSAADGLAGRAGHPDTPAGLADLVFPALVAAITAVVEVRPDVDAGADPRSVAAAVLALLAALAVAAELALALVITPAAVKGAVLGIGAER
jgi:hypothetical protein